MVITLWGAPLRRNLHIVSAGMLSFGLSYVPFGDAFIKQDISCFLRNYCSEIIHAKLNSLTIFLHFLLQRECNNNIEKCRSAERSVRK
jgi:hypothetical protein